MGENVVHVQTVHEHLGPRIELFLTPLGFFFFRQDHDVPLGQLGGQSHVLTAPTYGKAELFVRDDDLDLLLFFVEDNLCHLCRRKPVNDERGRIGRPLNDIDLFALQFAVPGAWLPGLLPYLTGARGFTEVEVGLVMAATTIGALLAPFYAGQLADRVINAERLLGICHLATAVLLCVLAQLETFLPLVLTGLVTGIVYAPTIALTNSISFAHIADRDRDFGPIRLWGTIGWIAAGILVGQYLLRFATPAEPSAGTTR